MTKSPFDRYRGVVFEPHRNYSPADLLGPNAPRYITVQQWRWAVRISQAAFDAHVRSGEIHAITIVSVGQTLPLLRKYLKL
jgi:hypothetical protein